ncbi:hypothetical protein SCUCBS95973_005876 [Sporothrix curviconia]|uniref:Uncharacterized protein n=1 Tax=Sporothrix curviconia TaxID=1260050 RepID=A0ABP0C0F7_9PEZI
MASAVSPAFLVDLKTARQRQDEHDYLFDKLHSRDETIRRRLERLAQVDAELQQYIQQRAEKGEKTAGDYVDKQRKTKTDNKNKHKDKIKDAEKKKTFKVTRGQARELRRQLWWLQHQIQQIEQDEEHLLMRLGEIMADLQARQWLGQIRQQRYQQYGQQAGWLAQAVDDDGFNSNSNSHSHSGSNSFDFGGYFDAVSPSHTLQAIPETAHEVASEAMAQATTETSSPPPQLTVDSSFVVSPVTPGLHATMPASPVSEAAVSAASRRASMTSPMSPLAPVFRPLSASAITPASTLAFAGMHYSREEAGEVFDDDDDGGSGDSGSSVSDTSFLPPDIRTRRVSHSSAASPTSPRQKRMSLPLVRFAWPENEEK